MGNAEGLGALMEEVRATNAHIGTCGIKRGVGQSTVSMTSACCPRKAS